MKSAEYLESVKQYCGITSDRELARHLGLGASTVNQYLKGQRIMDNEACLRIAEALNMSNPLPIIIAADMDRAEREGRTSAWERFRPKLFGGTATAALAILMFNNFLNPTPAQASELSLNSQNAQNSLYIMLNKISTYENFPAITQSWGDAVDSGDGFHFRDRCYRATSR
ncbi:transcriptional regulator with XRE-family HTH domain [Robbsia andropogonis]|uniref:helix-turn-helix domain-containing protein n=1 Tax=Robbsia andropogonis TaxID=28092 RepID=UPI003D206607